MDTLSWYHDRSYKSEGTGGFIALATPASFVVDSCDDTWCRLCVWCGSTRVCIVPSTGLNTTSSLASIQCAASRETCDWGSVVCINDVVFIVSCCSGSPWFNVCRWWWALSYCWCACSILFLQRRCVLIHLVVVWWSVSVVMQRPGIWTLLVPRISQSGTREFMAFARRSARQVSSDLCSFRVGASASSASASV